MTEDSWSHQQPTSNLSGLPSDSPLHHFTTSSLHTEVSRQVLICPVRPAVNLPCLTLNIYLINMVHLIKICCYEKNYRFAEICDCLGEPTVAHACSKRRCDHHEEFNSLN